GPAVSMTNAAPEFNVRSSVEAISGPDPDDCGKLRANTRGLPLLSKKFNRADPVAVPVLIKVKMVFQAPCETICAIDPVLVNPVVEALVSSTIKDSPAAVMVPER